MKTKLLLTLALLLSIATQAQTTAIPDSAFEQRLIDLGLDDVIDGAVLTSNVNAITTLSIANVAITDVTGIEAFVGLTTLDISDTTISSLDLTTLTNLTDLELSDNASLSLVSLADDDVNIIANDNAGLYIDLLSTHHNINLTGNQFVVFTTPLTSLTLSSTTITSLNGISSNTLMHLDLSGIPNLSNIELFTYSLLELNANNTNLSSLDTSSLFNLTTLNVSNTNLSSLDVFDLSSLMNLNITNTDVIINGFKNNVDIGSSFSSVNTNPNSLFITVSASISNLDLSFLYTYNLSISETSISSLDLSTLTNLTDLELSDNANLSLVSLADDDVNIIANDNAGLYIDLLSTHHNINLTGNEYVVFTSPLTSLTLSSTTITSLNGISSNTLTHLDLSGILNLSNIELFTYSLLELNANNTNLSSLDTSSLFNLTTLNVSNTNLSWLDAFDLLSINTLNVSNTNLSSLSVFNSNLSSLDVTGTTSLTNLTVSNSALTSLDLSTLTNLTNLYVSNNSNLIELNVKNGNNTNMPQTQFDSSSTPNLSCIEVDDVTYATTNWTNVDLANTFSTDCSNTLSTNSFNINSITLYPNPASNQITIAGINQTEFVEIYNIAGQTILETTVSNTKNTIDISRFSNGLYFLKLKDTTLKFIKE